MHNARRTVLRVRARPVGRAAGPRPRPAGRADGTGTRAGWPVAGTRPPLAVPAGRRTGSSAGGHRQGGAGRRHERRGSSGSARAGPWRARGRYRVDGGRQFRPQPSYPGRELVDVRRTDGRARAPLERRPAGEALVEHASERVLVGRAAAQPVAAPAPARGKAAVPRYRPGRGQPATAWPHELGDAEVGQVQVIRVGVVAGPLEKQVRRLDVPVHERGCARSQAPARPGSSRCTLSYGASQPRSAIRCRRSVPET